ncbi:MAG TPA: hypothetical protein VK177_07410 [Flavobacteriales bacterium]|nr:hypothetical protein [Flavobacteriales bacterium]
MQKICVLLMATFFYNVTAFSQFTYYKVTNGVKQQVQTLDKLGVTDDGSIVDNVLIEINLKEFQKKYNYDNFKVEYAKYYEDGKSFQLSYIHFTFKDPYVMKKFEGVDILKVYLYETPEVKKDPKALALTDEKVSAGMAGANYGLQVAGRYKVKVEEYYENGTWKKRDIFDTPVAITDPLKFMYDIPKEILVNQDYQNYVEPGGGGLGKISNELYTYLSLLNTGKAYIPAGNKEIVRTIGLVDDYKKKTIREEKDKQKAIDMVKVYLKEAESMKPAKEDTKLIKSLNKALKGKTDPDEIIGIYTKLNPK